MKNVIDITDLSTEELYDLMELATDIMDNPSKYSKMCKGKKLASLFFEPSTRTRLSFEAAMLDLGGNVLGFSEAGSSSSVKGESIADTSKIISLYADIIVMRHYLEGASLIASLNSDVPVINAGDGGHKHPTQTLADLLTIYKKKGRLNNLKIGLCGDLKYGRTVHSLVSAFKRYDGIEFVFISPKELSIPNYIKEELQDLGISYIEAESLENALLDLDVLYMTRIQEERFENKALYEELKDTYILNLEKLENASKDMIILHPLPRVNEISVEVDDDERACYFEEALYGKYMRMALILKLLNLVNDKDTLCNKNKKNKEDAKAYRVSEPKFESIDEDKYDDSLIGFLEKDELRTSLKCSNNKCVTNAERNIVSKFIKIKECRYRCYYCDKEV